MHYVTGYLVTAFPHEDDVNYRDFTLNVVNRGHGRWAILRHGDCWNRKTKQWDYESIPSERRDKWLADHRFTDLDEALDLAEKLAAEITVNGWTVDHANRMHNGEDLCGYPVRKFVRCGLTKNHEGDHKE